MLHGERVSHFPLQMDFPFWNLFGIVVYVYAYVYIYIYTWYMDIIVYNIAHTTKKKTVVVGCYPDLDGWYPNDIHDIHVYIYIWCTYMLDYVVYIIIYNCIHRCWCLRGFDPVTVILSFTVLLFFVYLLVLRNACALWRQHLLLLFLLVMCLCWDLHWWTYVHSYIDNYI